MVNESSCFDWFAVNGIPRKNDGMANFWSRGAEWTTIGACSETIYAKGELMAMRFYNRRLTGLERLPMVLSAVSIFTDEIPPVMGIKNAYR